MRNFGPTNLHGTAFAPKQWLHVKEATGMRVQKCIALFGADIVLSIGPRMEICGSSGLPIPMVPHLHQSNGNMKRKLQAWKVQKCIALVGADTIHTSAGPQTTPCHAE